MPRTRRTDPEIDALAAAMLATEGLTQIQIARTLGLNQTAVSRLLKTAAQYIQTTTRFRADKVEPQKMRRVLQRISPQRAKALGDQLAARHSLNWVPVVRVFECPRHQSYRERMECLARQAAPHLHDLIRRCHSIGVTWGGMLRFLVDALSVANFPRPWAEKAIEVIPLSGEPLGDEPTTYSSSSLAHDLNDLMNDGHLARSLGMVPAFIPQGFTAEQTHGVWRLIELVQSYNQIFGRKQAPLAGNVDMILTSVGPADRPLGFVHGRLLETGGVQATELRNLIVGDMGGVCFPKAGLDKAARKRLKSVTDRWTGLKLEHLAACAARAAAGDPFTGAPGVTILSIGQDRAPAIFESVRLGIVNHLIIDDELADELGRMSGPLP